MFLLSRGLFTFLVFTLVSALLLLHFHSIVINGVSAIHIRAKIVKAHYSPAALTNNYTMSIKKNKLQADVPALPDISKYSVANIAAQAPPYTPGRVGITGMVGLPGMREFIKKDGRVQRLRLSQMAVTPQIINIQEGHYDLTHLYEEVQKLSPGNQILIKDGSHYLLRMPILVGEGASLTISDKDTAELLLSQDQTVFIANAGDLYILNTKVTGWSEKYNNPSYFIDRLTFRPFFTSWSGGRMYIAGSTLSSLGYRKGKSYGITYSSCLPCQQVKPKLSPASGALVGNTFTDLYYGFYSYEAEDIAIVGNKYVDNAVYGIDPHDRSRHLIIAENEASGSGKKHGIIISRNVNDSWIFNNYSHNNHGSGIMLDRSCEHVVVANNITAYNQGDGITFYESMNDTVYNNKVYQNGLSGIRIRNSWNITSINDEITDNGGVPVVIYSMDLIANGKERDLKQDPYSIRAEATIVDSTLKLTDRKPAFKLDGVNKLALSGIRLLSGGPVFSGQLFPNETEISDNMDAESKSILFTNNPAPLTRLSER